MVDDRLLGAGIIKLGLVNSFGADVGKVEHVFLGMKVQGDDVLEILEHDFHFRPVRGDSPDVVLVAENQPGLEPVVPSLASPLIWLSRVVRWITLARVGAFTVDTGLRASALKEKTKQHE